jgi:hypothetical protein
MMNKYDAGYSFSYNERERLFHRLISFYIDLVERIDPSFRGFSIDTPFADLVSPVCRGQRAERSNIYFHDRSSRYVVT